MEYRLIDELGYEIDRGSLIKVQESCAKNYGSRIVSVFRKQVTVCGWREKGDGSQCLLIDNAGLLTEYNPALHKIRGSES